MGIIYKITNTINGKIYIGQTVCTLKKRWGEHVSASKSHCPTVSNSYFIRAIRKYSPDNFKHEIIEECPNDMLDNREIYWIKFYDSTNPAVGYNICRGGNQGYFYDFDTIYQLWDNGLSISEISRQTNINRVTVRHMLETYHNYSIEESRRRGSQHGRYHKICVSQYTVDGAYINSYESASAAERQVSKTTEENILRCCRQHKGLSGGYQWRFASDPPPSKLDCLPRCKSVLQYDTQGNCVNRYRSILEASGQTGVHKVSISMCCRHKIKRAGGFRWEYECPDQQAEAAV